MITKTQKNEIDIKNIVTILCSGVTLGVYIPALLVRDQLRRRNLLADVVVLESLFASDKREKINENKKAFHKNFSVALMGQKLTRNISSSLDHNLVNNLLSCWEKSKRRHFIIFSGFWMPIVEEYRLTKLLKPINVDRCYMDADISVSWRSYQGDTDYCNDIWFFSWEKKKLIYEIPVINKAPIPFAERADRFVIHGGGWGIGTYQSKIPELEKRGLALDIAAYDLTEAVSNKEGNRYFMIDPSWCPWVKGKNDEHEFPHFGEVKDGKFCRFKNKNTYPLLFDYTKKSRAIISKPGGMTLVDSLASATPLVYLEPFGEHEQKNAELWEHMKFGISYNNWKELDYSTEILEFFHKNLLKARGSYIDYGGSYSL